MISAEGFEYDKTAVGGMAKMSDKEWRMNTKSWRGMDDQKNNTVDQGEEDLPTDLCIMYLALFLELNDVMIEKRWDKHVYRTSLLQLESLERSSDGPRIILLPLIGIKPKDIVHGGKDLLRDCTCQLQPL